MPRFAPALLVAFASCAATPTRPLPPRSVPAPLDDAFFAASPGDAPRMRVHLIDVGQGAATLIELSCAAILIDTGGESNRYMDSTKNLVDYLRAFFATRPDLHDKLALVVLTHPHIDHTRGARVVLGEFEVGNLVTEGEPPRSVCPWPSPSRRPRAGRGHPSWRSHRR